MCRLGHKKSRKGCINCKRRRVKCDEQAPCRNCVRRGEDCSLLVPSPSADSDKNSALPTTSQEWMDDLSLMRHFVRETALQPLGTSDEGQFLWQENITDEALKYPLVLRHLSNTLGLHADIRHSVLMHGILALSALHLMHTQPVTSERYLRLCDNHQTKAIEMFRSMLSNDMNAEMSVPIFALATTLSISSVAKSCAMALAVSEPRCVDIEQILEMFMLTRGVKDVVTVYREVIMKSPMAPMLVGYEVPHDAEITLSESIHTRLKDLTQLVESTCNPEQLAPCQDAVARLEWMYRVVAYHEAKDNLQTGHLYSWMTSVSNEYVAMIKDHSPVALVILADFVTASLTLESAWYTRNWGHYCLRGISKALREDDYLKWLEWPKAQAHDNMAILKESRTPGGTTVRDAIA